MHLLASRSQVWPAGHWPRRVQSAAVLDVRHWPSSVEQNSPKGQGRASSQSSAKGGLSWQVSVESSQTFLGSTAMQSSSTPHSAARQVLSGAHTWPIGQSSRRSQAGAGEVGSSAQAPSAARSSAGSTRRTSAERGSERVIGGPRSA